LIVFALRSNVDKLGQNSTVSFCKLKKNITLEAACWMIDLIVKNAD